MHGTSADGAHLQAWLAAGAACCQRRRQASAGAGAARGKVCRVGQPQQGAVGRQAQQAVQGLAPRQQRFLISLNAGLRQRVDLRMGLGGARWRVGLGQQQSGAEQWAAAPSDRRQHCAHFQHHARRMHAPPCHRSINSAPA